MKDYTIIPNQISPLFSPNDIYTLVGLYFTAHKDYKTDVTYEQLHKLTGQSIDYIKKGFSKRLAKSNFSLIELSFDNKNVKTRKLYTLPKPKINYRFIRKEIFQDKNLTSEEKGFLIGLYCNSVNDTFSVGLPVEELLIRLKIKKSTFYKLKKSLLEKGYMSKVKDMPAFIRSEDFAEDFMLTCPWLGYEDYTTWIDKNQYENFLD